MKLGWRGAIGIALTVLLLAWALRGTNLDEVARELSRANIPLLILSAILATGVFPLRARRWRTILDPIAPHLPFGELWRATAIGMMVNNVLPARAGEPARAYALSRETPRVPFSAAFASLAVDRLFDGLVILLLMFGAVFSPAFPQHALGGDSSVANWAGSGVIALVVLLLLLYLIVFFPARIVGLYELLARRVAPRFEARGREVLLAFASGLSVLRSPGRFVAVLWWTLLHWLLNALAFWVGFRAVGIDAPFSAALFLQGVIALGVALPSSPGFFGVFEAAAKVGLAVYAIDATHAVSWAIGYHLLSFIPITVIGVYYFTRLGLSLADLRRVTGNGQAPDEADAAVVEDSAR